MTKPKPPVGIITLYGEYNYGNRLQNYALSQALLSLGFAPETIVFRSRRAVFMAWVKRFVKRALSLLRLRPLSPLDQSIPKRSAQVAPFTKKYIPTLYANRHTFDTKKYAAFIVGSDQVWNPHYVGRDDDYFLAFAPESKRVAYAASFGVSSLPSETKNFYREHIASISHLSVREQDGARLIQKLDPKLQPQVVPDPTMLLARKDWQALADQTSLPADLTRGKYILVYTLEGLSKSMEAELKKHAKSHGYRIQTIIGNKPSKDHLIPDVPGFLSLIAHADLVVTDSFHACVFSIIFQTPFTVFEREDGAKMFSRIKTLLDKFGLRAAIFGPQRGFSKTITKSDFSRVNQQLKVWSSVGYAFLRSALNVADKP